MNYILRFFLTLSVYLFACHYTHAQCINWEQFSILNASDTNLLHQNLSSLNWSTDNPDKKVNFNRNIISFSYKVNDTPKCWLDLCFKKNMNSILVLQFNNEMLYSDFKNQIKSAGFTQSKMKLGNDDIALAFTKDNDSYLLRKHTYNHDTQGSYAILKLNTTDLENTWKTYINF